MSYGSSEGLKLAEGGEDRLTPKPAAQVQHLKLQVYYQQLKILFDQNRPGVCKPNHFWKSTFLHLNLCIFFQHINLVLVCLKSLQYVLPFSTSYYTSFGSVLAGKDQQKGV